MGRGTEWLYKKVNEDWIAESPMGTVKVKFAEKNQFGVLDHDVTLRLRRLNIRTGADS